ncbi:MULTISPECIES: hypothetical protein [Sinorhizobium]|uniref:Uncharacterized protein n=1 Tax=Sinorhizobium americanum TaxID=194963 RepID=A0A2S3YVU3_9HYPH|nr:MULTISPECIES: hypothetical protein [Sinorhizobium]PDT39806.1 hypothetical protein CO656_19270 [Sinorhizobium sp. FG01]POH35727.1 hypothetical protein ATY31_00380 [Sinorhizobium americanum]
MTYLDEDAERAVQLFMAEYAVSRDEALRLIVRDWLIGHAYLSQSEEGELTKREPEGDAEIALGGA